MPIHFQESLTAHKGLNTLEKTRYVSNPVSERREATELEGRLKDLTQTLQSRSIVLESGSRVPMQLNRFPTATNPASQTFLKTVEALALLLQQGLISLGTASAIQQSRVFLEAVASKIASFFFGFKKEKAEERERRAKDDFARSDFFTHQTVEATGNGGRGGKR